MGLELAFLSLALALGTLAAVRPHTRIDVGISVLTAFGTAMPNFWIGILLILVFAFHLRVLPSSGSIPVFEDPLGHLRAMVLPVVRRLFGGAVAMETIFTLPGVGILLVDSILGRDVLSQIIAGARISMVVGVLSVAAGLCAGTAGPGGGAGAGPGGGRAQDLRTLRR